LEVELAVVDALSLQKRTFVSDIDGSVQYFAVRPALKDAPDNGLILTLHGAGVEARGQAAAYKSKEWAHIVAPTNRRPYGFDWEDWGRIDAMEVLDIAKSDLAHDPQRIYLTGHSMGGHGTWQVGSTFPGEFAAIAPSAGWISFESYGGGRGGGNRNADNADAMQQIMRRAGNSSRTLELQHNLNGLGIYILHGDKDDNVPVEQARTMKAELEKWHHDLEYHEQPGAGHWWGDECVDWPPLMEFLSKHGRPAAKAIDHVQFATASPGVNASRDWVTIQQQRCMDFSRVDLKRDLTKRTISGTTENVARITLDVSDFEGEGEITVELDGQSVRAQASRQAIELERNGDKWGVAAAPLAPSHKTPARCGPFKSAFNHRFMFVYGTKGTAEENAWAFKKARFDAETFWYRGNGSVDVVADVDFNPRDNASRDRSVILYGNADTNAVWDALLHDSPVQVHRGQIKMSDRAMNGDDLACLMIRPRPGSDIASVGVVSGTGAIGARITDRLPYFVSGVAYPDCIVFDGSGLARGGLGIRAAGYFGNDWSIEHGEFGWQQ
ncbi:MAG TPA: prolyl oligopeptidase family serine peptidase, partial [Phycisphaerales bacterium]|nr:prolyl oligopeptidase family serine peptidase [Phycisphaerales bacterium]